MSLIGQVVAQNPNRSGHVAGIDSGSVNPLLADEHFGDVERRLIETSFMRMHLDVRTIRGTDTLTSRRMGAVQLQKLERGVIPGDNSPTYDSISIKVDTVVIARATEWTLEDFQNDRDFRRDISEEQGDEIAMYFDMCHIAQAVKASQITLVDPEGNETGGWGAALSPDGTPSVAGRAVAIKPKRSAPAGHRGGTVIVLDAAGDETDPVAAELAHRRAKTEIMKKHVNERDLLWLMDWDWQETLSRNENLITTDLNRSDNGSWSDMTVYRAGAVKVHPTTFMPEVVHVRGVSDHFLSNAGNGYAYNNTANDVKCRAVLIAKKTLLSGETIPLTTKIWFDDLSKMWYIDAWTAFACTANRPEYAAGIYEFGVA